MAKRGRLLRGKVRRARERASGAFRRWTTQVRALNWRRRRTAELLRSWRRAPAADRPRLRKLIRLSRTLAAKSRAEAIERGEEFREAKRRRLAWEAALRRYRKLVRRPFPHLSGDLDCEERVLRKLEAVGRDVDRNIFVTSGRRSQAEQKALWDNRASNPFPVAFCCPCTSAHCEGNAADCTIGGVPIQFVVPAATLVKHGLRPLAGDAVHVEG